MITETFCSTLAISVCILNKGCNKSLKNDRAVGQSLDSVCEYSRVWDVKPQA